MGDNKDKMTLKKGGANTNLDTREGRSERIMFYLKKKRYVPEVLSTQEANIIMP